MLTYQRQRRCLAAEFCGTVHWTSPSFQGLEVEPPPEGSTASSY